MTNNKTLDLVSTFFITVDWLLENAGIKAIGEDVDKLHRSEDGVKMLNLFYVDTLRLLEALADLADRTNPCYAEGFDDLHAVAVPDDDASLEEWKIYEASEAEARAKYFNELNAKIEALKDRAYDYAYSLEG